MSKNRIREFINYYGEDGVYISFSGGKDSTVLIDLVRQDYLNVEAVYLDTWLEYPQIRSFVHGFSNLKIIKPEKSMKQIIQEDGWCFPSKDMAECIEAYRRGLKWADNKLHGLDGKGQSSAYRERYTKWLKLADTDIPISHKCCIDMKERPVAKYEKESDKKPIVGLLADESARRKEAYLRTGCNSFESKRPMSKPIGFWTEQDILLYIKMNNLPIASPYGKIVYGDGYETTFCESCQKLKTTGESRTGCMFCPVSGHLDNFQKIERVKQYNPSIHDFIMEELNMKKLIEYVRKEYVK